MAFARLHLAISLTISLAAAAVVSFGPACARRPGADALLKEEPVVDVAGTSSRHLRYAIELRKSVWWGRDRRLLLHARVGFGLSFFFSFPPNPCFVLVAADATAVAANQVRFDRHLLLGL